MLASLRLHDFIDFFIMRKTSPYVIFFDCLLEACLF